MTGFTRLHPSMPLNTPKGIGECIGIIDYGPEADLLWVVIDDKTGQIWTWGNVQVRGVKNISLGRNNPETLNE